MDGRPQASLRHALEDQTLEDFDQVSETQASCYPCRVSHRSLAEDQVWVSWGQAPPRHALEDQALGHFGQAWETQALDHRCQVSHRSLFGVQVSVTWAQG